MTKSTVVVRPSPKEIENPLPEVCLSANIRESPNPSYGVYPPVGKSAGTNRWLSAATHPTTDTRPRHHRSKRVQRVLPGTPSRRQSPRFFRSARPANP